MGEVTIQGPGPFPNENAVVFAVTFLRVMSDGDGTAPPEVIGALAKEYGEDLLFSCLELCEVQGYIEKMDYTARPLASAKITEAGRAFVRTVKETLGE